MTVNNWSANDISIGIVWPGSTELSIMFKAFCLASESLLLDATTTYDSHTPRVQESFLNLSESLARRRFEPLTTGSTSKCHTTEITIHV